MDQEERNETGRIQGRAGDRGFGLSERHLGRQKSEWRGNTEAVRSAALWQSAAVCPLKSALCTVCRQRLGFGGPGGISSPARDGGDAPCLSITTFFPWSQNFKNQPTSARAARAARPHNSVYNQSIEPKMLRQVSVIPPRPFTIILSAKMSQKTPQCPLKAGAREA